MDKQASNDTIYTNLLEHPAVKAWSQLRPKRVKPDWVEAMKGKWEQTQNSAICRLRGVGWRGSDVIAKRCHRKPGIMERTIYEKVLSHLPVPTPHYYGFVEEPGGEFCCLFMEDAGENRYSSEIEEHRALAATWVGLMHVSALSIHLPADLPDRGPAHYEAHLQAAYGTMMKNMANPALTADDVEVLATVVSQCAVLASRWSQLKRFCAGMPQTLVHGDFKIDNVSIQTSRTRMRFLAFDWEHAGWGAPAEDLAGLQATIDISAYWSAVRDQWPHLDLEAVQRLFFVGKVFRWTVAFDWETVRLANEWVEKSMYRIRYYSDVLSSLLRAAEWDG